MGSIGNMFSRRAAASESSHARDEAKLSLRRMNEKKQAALDAQQEKIDDLQKALAGTKNSAVKDAISKKIEQEQTALNDMRAQQEKIAARVAGGGQCDDGRRARRDLRALAASREAGRASRRS